MHTYKYICPCIIVCMYCMYKIIFCEIVPFVKNLMIHAYVRMYVRMYIHKEFDRYICISCIMQPAGVCVLCDNNSRV